MGYLGYKPADKPLTAADITDGIITSAKIVDGTIVNADINASAAIVSTKLSGVTSPAAFRNIVINGDMQVAQRSTSVASISSGNTYNALDRFRVDINSLGTWTMSQSTDVPSGYGFSNSLKMDCTTADASPAAGDVLLIQTRFEGQNLQYLKKGTANAQSLTLSFWVKSTKTGTFICNLIDDTNARLNAQSYTVSVSNTWEFKTVTFPADTTGTLANTNGSGLSLSFWLGAGTDFTSGTLQTTWASTVNTNRAVGQVNCADSTSNDWLITGVQLEAGTSATDFEFLPYDINLKRCFRYFYSTIYINGANSFTAPTDNGLEFDGSRQVFADVTGYRSQFIQHPVTMRATPSIAFFNGNNSGTSGQFYLRLHSGATQNFSGFTQAFQSHGFNFAGYTGISIGGSGEQVGIYNVHYKCDSEL